MRENFVQGWRRYNIPITIPAGNSTTPSTLGALITAGIAALTASAKPLGGAGDYNTFTLDQILGVKIDGYLPGSAGTQRPAIMIADAVLTAGGAVDTARAQYKAAGVDYAEPATQDWNNFIVAAANAPISALAIVVIVPAGAV